MQGLFIVGCPRSGTTLIQQITFNHSMIHSFPESHFFDRGFGGTKKYKKFLKVIFGGLWLYYCIVQWKKKFPENKENLLSTKLYWSRSKYIQEFRSVMEYLTEQAGATIWVEKTPAHLRHIETIAKYMPDVKFIHIIRNGKAVVASLYTLGASNLKQWSRFSSIELCIERWNESINISNQYASNSSHLIVSYDKLLENCESEIKRICDFIGINYEKNMINIQENSNFLIAQHELAWKENNLKPFKYIKINHYNKYEKLFNEKQKKYIENRLNWKSYCNLLKY